jgi:hypothetical protein
MILLMSDEVIIGEVPLSEWRQMPWWPNDEEARIHAGQAGHDREIVLNVGNLGTYTWNDPIPDIIVMAVKASLPDSWQVDDRGTRIEIHPTGRFAGGFTLADVELVKSILPSLGFVLSDVIVSNNTD